MEINQSLHLKQDTILDRVLLGLATILFILTLIVVILQVVVRTFNLPFALAWTGSAARYFLVVGTYFGAAVASRNNEHIQMDIVLRKLEKLFPNLKHLFDVLVYIIVAGTGIIVTFGLYEGALGAWNSHLGDVSGLTIGMIYLAIGVGFNFMILFEMLKFKKWVPIGSNSVEVNKPGDSE